MVFRKLVIDGVLIEYLILKKSILYIHAFSGNYNRTKSFSAKQARDLIDGIEKLAIKFGAKKIYMENQVRTSSWLHQIKKAEERGLSKENKSAYQDLYRLFHNKNWKEEVKKIKVGTEPGVNDRWSKEIKSFLNNDFIQVKGRELANYITHRREGPAKYLKIKLFPDGKLKKFELVKFNKDVDGYMPNPETAGRMIHYNILLKKEVSL